MLKNELKIKDNVNDLIRDTLQKLGAIQFWNKEKNSLINISEFFYGVDLFKIESIN